MCVARYGIAPRLQLGARHQSVHWDAMRFEANCGALFAINHRQHTADF